MKHLLEEKALSTNDVLLVPKQGIVASRSEVDSTANPIFYSAPMDSVTGPEMVKAMWKMRAESPVVNRFMSKKDRKKVAKEYHNEEDVFFSIGLLELMGGDNVIRMFYNDPTPMSYALDIAHGDMEVAWELIPKFIEDTQAYYFMSGSICTPEAAIRAVNAGCTHLRVGVGPGAACTTRLVTGCGFPNLSAVYRIKKAVGPNIKVIADGGIKHPGDVVKYLAAGADGVMMGSIFSKAKESAGWKTEELSFFDKLRGKKPRLYKTYRGQASADFQFDQYDRIKNTPEGASSKPFYWDGKTTVDSILAEYYGGIKSACSYLGLDSMEDLKPSNVEFVQITSATYIEGTPHGV